MNLFILPFPYFLIQPFFNYSSDSISTYYLAGIVLIISLFTSTLLHLFKFEKQAKLGQFLYISIAYILSYFLLKYGIDKLLLHQFYKPEPNILFTPVGALSKDILFWSTMGTSKIYNIFMGLIEIIPGLLLLHHKTRVFGAFCAFGVLLNVFMINAGFDISVKLLSLNLLISTIFLLSPVFKQLFNLFIKQKEIIALSPPHLLMSNDKLKRLIKASVISLMLFDVCLPYLASKSNQEIQIDKVIGSYESKNEHVLFLNHAVKRIHIHGKGYLIIEDLNQKFYDYKFTFIESSIYLLKEKIEVEIDQQNKTISWIENGFSKSIKIKKVNTSSIPLLKDDFHCTVEEFQ